VTAGGRVEALVVDGAPPRESKKKAFFLKKDGWPHHYYLIEMKVAVLGIRPEVVVMAVVVSGVQKGNMAVHPLGNSSIQSF